MHYCDLILYEILCPTYFTQHDNLNISQYLKLALNRHHADKCYLLMGKRRCLIKVPGFIQRVCWTFGWYGPDTH